MITYKEYVAEDTGGAELRATSEGVEEFVNSRFGVSVHFGLYSLNGRGEWVMYDERIPPDVYRRRMESFNPARFTAEEWADLMLESGLRFLVFIAKHHDGFCLWDTALTDFKITGTPFGRDILAELAPALRDRGLKLHIYYSLPDWSHPDFKSDWPAYIDYYQGQLRELMTNYGKVCGVLFDGYWPRQEFEGDEIPYFRTGGEWDLAGTYDLIHELQPNAMIVNNHHIMPLRGEDYQIWELDMPGENTLGRNAYEVGDVPQCVWWNLNTGWGYDPRKHNPKSPDEIVRALHRTNKEGAVFLLNVAARPFGDIHPEEQQMLRQVGRSIRDATLSE